MQIRPCFLVIDAEHASSISTRKLVLETAKYNVITAYSCQEAIATLQRLPALHAVVINGLMRDCPAQFLEVMQTMPELKLVVVGDGPLAHGLRAPDVLVESFAPPKLLEALQRLFPVEAKQLLKREHDLELEEV